MFLEDKRFGPFTPPDPPPTAPKLTPRQERILAWVIAANIVLLLIAPIGGATLFHALAVLLGA